MVFAGNSRIFSAMTVGKKAAFARWWEGGSKFPHKPHPPLSSCLPFLFLSVSFSLPYIALTFPPPPILTFLSPLQALETRSPLDLFPSVE